MSQVRAGGAYVELTARSTQFLKGLEAAQKRLKSFGASTRLVGTKLTGLGVAAAAPVGASLAVYTSFDDAIRAAGAAANATGATLESLRNKAKHLGATTSFSASEVASLMTELGRAGFSPKQIEEMTGAVMNLARATGTDATVSSGIMSATIRQFSLEATDAVRVSDRLTAAANMSFNSVESLGEALQYAGPVAADANMSLEETLAVLGTLGNLGIQGSEAGTALRRLLTLGAAESEKFQKVFGVATKDAQGNARDLVDILGEVATASANMGSGDRAQAFNEVFGLMGITSASAIGKTVTDTKKLLADLKKSNGIADKTAGDMDAGIGGAFRILKSSIEGVAIAIGESLDLSVTKMMKAISRALSGLIEWIGKNQEVVKKVALIVAGVVAVGAAFIGIGSAAGVAAFAVGGLASMFSLVGTAIGVLVTMIGALFTPIGLVVAAVAALGAYFIYSSGIAGEAIEYLKGVFETLKADTIKAFGAIAKALAAGDITAAANVLWTYLKLQWIKGTTYLKGVWADFTNYLSDIWGDTAYAIGDVLISALSGLASVWNATLGFMADGWTILTTSVQKGWNATIGFLKKGFIRLRELVDIAGDVSVQIGGVLINALAGVETAWVETIDYLADTWSVFVAQVKSMWNSTVGFLRKAWIKLKSLFDDDVNVEVEMAKIDKEIRTADEAEENKKQQAIADRMKRRDARKQQIESNRVQMQEGIKQQLEERRKARAGRDIDAEMAVIDRETEAKNQTVDASKEEQFKQNEAASESRQKTIDDTTAGVQETLDQMREEARVAREAGRQSPEDRAKERDQQVAAAQAEFDAAVETANAAKPQDPTLAKEPGPPLPDMPAPPKPGALKVPKVEVDGIKDPKLKPPKKKDLKLGLDRSAKDSMDRFSDGPEEPTEKTEAAGNFDSRGLGLGSGASLIPAIEPPDQKDKVDPDGVDADVNAGADANDPELKVPEVEPEFGLQPVDAEVSSPEDFIEPTAVDQEPSLNLESIMASFAAVRVRLEEFDAALSQSVARLQMPQVAGEGLSDDVKRAIIQTAENTSQLAERARTGGFVFS
ncbi:MAG: phage tail tape measure protein [Planctomycetes bacterium]|nr:phage tail tape measure protein [Planctomycetota bacterium]